MEIEMLERVRALESFYTLLELIAEHGERLEEKDIRDSPL